MSTADQIAEFIFLWDKLQHIQLPDIMICRIQSHGAGQLLASTLQSELTLFSFVELIAVSTVRPFGMLVLRESRRSLRGYLYRTGS
jgi:hypothetical protein